VADHPRSAALAQFADGFVTILQIVAGLALLATGGEALVRGASRLAALLGVTPLVIGLTVVALGTSAPELVVSTYAAFHGSPDIAVANVIGSNIFNVLVVLGVCALLRPLVVTVQLLRRDVPILIAVTGVFVLLALDHRIARLEGGFLLAAMVAYTVFAVSQSRRESAAVEKEYAEALRHRRVGRTGWLFNLGSVLAGLALLVLGARWLVDGSVTVARNAGVSEAVIGLTIVAIGTSLPEVAASAVATLRGERDIAVGNVIGSSLYNILAILGVAAAVAPQGLHVDPSLVRFDLPILLATTVACLPLLFTGRTLARWEGGLLLGLYAAYAAYLVLAAQAHAALPMFSRAMLFFVLPLVGITIAWSVAHSLLRDRRLDVPEA
jgi:cation:H+ antiporter